MHASALFHVIISDMEQVRFRYRSRRSGFSLIELLIVIAIILILLAIAVPKFSSARMNATETVVIREVQTIHQAQTQYYSQFGRYAQNLPELAGLIPKALADGKKGGYIFAVRANPGGYSVTANPDVYDSTGRFRFYSDQTVVIRRNTGKEPANAGSPEIP